MSKFLIAFAACSGLALAQNETFNFFWPHADDLLAPGVIIKTVNASATVFNAACPSPSSQSSCDWLSGLNYTIFDQSTYEATVTGDEFALTRTCVDRSTEVNCYAEGFNGRIKSQYLANEVWASDATNTVTATIASGAEKLKAAPTSTASGSGSAPMVGSAVTSTGASVTGSASSAPEATGTAVKNHASLAAGLVALCAGATLLYT
ncbi:hypothetical protein SVAN01_00006 [Stagonosporopsis vannaccii]|nr:hypothetical protein SVAN01_00006 [Stagonosporopsis vannaccii]